MNMSVTLTEAAARHVTRYLAKRGKGVGVRLGVKTTGCSGLAYKLEYVDEVVVALTVLVRDASGDGHLVLELKRLDLRAQILVLAGGLRKLGGAGRAGATVLPGGA